MKQIAEIDRTLVKRTEAILETVKRGYVPKDTTEFGPKATAELTAAAQELVFLLDRGYDTKSASSLR